MKLSNHLIEVDEKMRSLARSAHSLLIDILYKENSSKRKRRKADKKLAKLLDYMEKIDALGYQLKLEICTKKEINNEKGGKK